jgi:hypothetical protein
MRPLFRALAGLCLLAACVLPAAATDTATAPRTALDAIATLFHAFAADEPRVEPGFRGALDLRLRQEHLDQLYYWSPAQPDRNWIRLRSRAGAAYGWGQSHEAEARLCSEFRKIRTPDTPINYDEIVLDRLLYRYRPSAWATLTLGRQDIAWDDGFLVMDGTPLDGSRSAYMNAIRLELTAEDPDLSLLEAFFAHNPATDDFVLWDDDIERRLTDADETAAALRARFAQHHQVSLIWKRERDPDHARPAIDAWTFGYRGERSLGTTSLMGELALQYQDWSAPANTSGLAWAMQSRLRRELYSDLRLDLGFYWYSGRIGELLAFRTPWGRWPKWSELMLYRLIGEGGVGAWANLAGPWIEVERRKQGVLLGVGAQALLAPEPRWAGRDLLLRVRLERSFAAGLSAQLIAEVTMGSGGDSVDYQPAFGASDSRMIEASGGAFLRWQVTYELK